MASNLLVLALVATLFGCLQAVIIPDVPCSHGNNWVQVVSFNVIPAEETKRNGSKYDGVTYAAESTFFDPLLPSTRPLAHLHFQFELQSSSSTFLIHNMEGYDDRWLRKGQVPSTAAGGRSLTKKGSPGAQENEVGNASSHRFSSP